MLLHIFRYRTFLSPIFIKIDKGDQGNDYMHLPVIESYDYLRTIRVPQGIFLNSKTSTTRSDRYSYYSDDSEFQEESGHGSPLSPVGQYPSPPRSPHASNGTSPSLMSAALMHGRHLPFPQGRTNILPPITDSRDPAKRNSALALPQLKPPRATASSPSAYAPLTPEDRRALDKLRVVL